ncbi:MAG: Ubiquitin recognition factor in ER-associated degradation protein 1, partial [Paramarteilia canceri]
MFLGRFEATLLNFTHDKSETTECGGKIILPNSALIFINSSESVDYPLLFKITNRKSKKSTHCGVLQFTAEEGSAYLPYW